MAIPPLKTQFSGLTPGSSHFDSLSSCTPPNKDPLFPSQELVSSSSALFTTEEPPPFKEFQQLVRETRASLNRDPIDAMLGRDRYPDITPFAFNQVRIDNGSIGMNGSRISFPDHDPDIKELHLPGKYIAMSAPMPSYFFPFMRMLSQEAISLIICLTHFKEEEMPKAHQYLPFEEQASFVDRSGNFSVTCTKAFPEIELCDGWFLEQREFELLLKGSTKPHRFSQWYLPDWRDQTPGDIEGVVNLVKLAYEKRKSLQTTAPILVHCSGGIGRAGVFINCSEGYERWIENRPLNILQILKQSQLQRRSLGGHEEQYKMVFAVCKKFMQEALEQKSHS